MRLSLLVISMLFLFSCSEKKSIEREVDFNFDWKFYLGDDKSFSSTEYNDETWRQVQLPHDWSVEHDFTQEEAAGATAYLPGGIGWYRKTFIVPENAADMLSRIEFDGVYSNSEVWINGHYLGKRPYGYTAFSYDLSKHLKYGEENCIAVRVDRSAYIDCRWYPGSGIYRNVKLLTTNKLHVPQYGVFITTPEVSEQLAIVNVAADVQNDDVTIYEVIVKASIVKEGQIITSQEKSVKVPSNGSKKVENAIVVESPALWNVNCPSMYTSVVEVIVDEKIVDRISTPFGIRTFNFDSNKGFFLNGKNMLLKGVCLHHDGGLVGAAVPRGVWERRLKKMKEAGVNAIRTAHNPPSAEFLDLCDEMGFLVQDEAFDEWNNPKDKRNNYNQTKAEKVTKGYTEHFSEWSERDLKTMVLRDRNHPSIIMWSIGNEIEWTYGRYGAATGYWAKDNDANYYWDEPPYNIAKVKKNFDATPEHEHVLATTAQQLSKWVKEVDISRPVTANLVIPTVSNLSGYADALDIVGLSYRQAVYDYCKRNYPDKVFLGTENWARQHEWQPVLDKNYISGIFLWTGIDYMGESRSWPKRGSSSGLLDFAGFEKPSYYMFKSLWSDEAVTYITTQTAELSPYKLNKKKQVVEKEKGWASHQKWGWQTVNEHWNYNKGEPVAVEVYTNEPEIELFLNGKSMGTRFLSKNKDHVLKWIVPFEAGELIAKGKKSSYKINTAKELKSIQLTVDRDALKANKYDVAHYTVQLLDEVGNPIHHKNQEVEFHIEGDATLLGVDNGAVNIVQRYQSSKLTTSNGRALMILQSTDKPGTVHVYASCGEVKSDVVEVLVQ